MNSSPDPLDLSVDERAAVGHDALDIALDCFREAGAFPVYPAIDARTLTDLVAEPLPIDPQPARQVLDDCRRLVLPYGRRNGHPRMFGYISSAAAWMGVVGDLVASALNQNVTSWRSAPGPTTIERLVIDWIKTALGYDPRAAGLLVSGGSMANFAALATALHAKGGAGVTRRGVRGLEADPVIYASTLVHMSVPKAAGLLGIGRDAVRTVPIGPDFAIDCAALEAAIAGDRGAGRLPLAVVASAGDVNTGGFDSIRAVTEVCRTERVWCHVDACYGGFAALAPSARPLFDGIEQADSVALDPHKWLFTPLDAGCLLVRDPSTLRSAFSHGGDYLDVVDSPSDFAFWDYGLELSRRFRALKIWMILKRHGTAAIGDAIERNLRLARRLGDLVNASDDFERLAPVGLSIVCFRHLPATLRAAVSSSDPAERARASDRADALNRAILVALQRGGADAYLSNASIDGRFALRACLVNYRTTEADLEILLDVVRDTARRIGPGM